MCRIPPTRRQSGLTLLEVLIAISIFALIGVASFQVLTSVIATQQKGDQHASRLATFQKALSIIDRDLQQFVDRPIRSALNGELPSLMVHSGDFPLELTRGGWANPLLLSRSRLQRIAYDIGPHPQADDPDSVFFDDERQYLRRIFWVELDRRETVEPFVQALLPGVSELQLSVISNRGQHDRWPAGETNRGGKPPKPKALEFSLLTEELGLVTRTYKIEFYQH